MRDFIQNTFRRMDSDAFFKASVRRGAQAYLAKKALEDAMTEEELRMEEKREEKRFRKGKYMVFFYVAAVLAVGIALAYFGSKGTL